MTKPSASILERARERTGDSQEAIAAKFDITQAAVSLWESHDRAPHPSLWADIADAYGISIHEVTEHFLKARKAS